MRTLHDHETNPANKQISIEVLDDPGPGGANHRYMVLLQNAVNAKDPDIILSFQNGPILEGGVNGITQEVLLAVLIDRLRGFQNGKFACRPNAIALTHLEEALMWLLHRTRERESRGVEGTMTP